MATPWTPPAINCVGCHRVLHLPKSAWSWTCICGCENDYFNTACVNLQCRKPRPAEFRPLSSCTFCRTMMTLPPPQIQAPPPAPAPAPITVVAPAPPPAVVAPATNVVYVQPPRPVVTVTPGVYVTDVPRYVTTTSMVTVGSRTVSCPFCQAYVSVNNTGTLSSYTCGRCMNVFRA